jgi:hypothetical protein
VRSIGGFAGEMDASVIAIVVLTSFDSDSLVHFQYA